MTIDTEPVMVWPLAHYLIEEMQARGWTTVDVAQRMAGTEYGMDKLALDMLLAVQDDNLVIDDETFAGLARAFDVSEELFRNLDASWRRWPAARQPIEVPESIFGAAP